MELLLDGRPASVRPLTDALRAALDGAGPAVFPLPTGGVRPDGEPRQDTALVISTSGSTGTPRAVELSAAALRASAAATHARLHGPGGWLLALPAHHVAGVQVLVRSLLAGREPAVMALHNGFRPRAFTEAASDLLGCDGPHYTSLVPTQLIRLLDDGGDALAALRTFDAVLIGGAAAQPTLMARAQAAGVRTVATYGMTETAGGCVYDGLPLDGVRVRLSDGRIELAGPMLASGYLGAPAATAESFADGWFRTTDLGRFKDNGELEVLGRADDVINTGGVKVPPVLVEAALAELPEVAHACVVGVPDAKWGETVAAALVAAAPIDEDALRAHVRTRLGAPSIPTLIRFFPSLPTLSSGKVDRAAVRAALDQP